MLCFTYLEPVFFADSRRATGARQSSPSLARRDFKTLFAIFCHGTKKINGQQETKNQCKFKHTRTTDGKHGSFVEAIETLGWGKLIDLERYVNPELVKEFYANALLTNLSQPFPYMTMVRNRHIRFDRNAINDFLGKPYNRASEDDLCDYATTMARGNWDVPEMTELLLLQDCNIIYGKSGLPVRAKGEDMNPLARLALLFFLHNVMPRSHISDATMPMLGLIYCFYREVRPQFGDGMGTYAGANADGEDDPIDEEVADAFVDDDGDGMED
ncbi:hypothetical protein TSUD_55170 [Trifolium subterraneum]|uniref:Putative plant transposon protein domain-containing protein n=1 Tax=Trifolium subterraneum TaxID=3900 RepID=A0A2Z6M4J0_TRISU|nr:hypothetical protein TSUD_55170 [Trifolium subterraneum]